MPIQKKTNRLYQRVANTLAREIRAEKFVPAQRLPAERDLAQRFDVSRPTIREAIIALEITGLVDVRKGSGVYVREDAAFAGEVSGLDIGPFELIEARALFEGEIVALAAKLATDEQVQELEKTLDDMEQEYRESGSAEMADREFHIAIARITNNSAIVAALEQMWDVRYHSPLCIRLMNQVRETDVRPIIQEHKIVVEAIASRDPEQAKSAMHDHLTQTTQGLLEATEIDALERAREEVERQRKRFTGRVLQE